MAEYAHKGRTLLEKFEQITTTTGFAVVLATADDIGKLNDTLSNGQLRARQNVILELGYFIGKLGRDKVALITKGNLELPSDLFGMGYIDVGYADDWRASLAAELNAAGIEVDTNKHLRHY